MINSETFNNGVSTGKFIKNSRTVAGYFLDKIINVFVNNRVMYG